MLKSKINIWHRTKIIYKIAGKINTSAMVCVNTFYNASNTYHADNNLLQH